VALTVLRRRVGGFDGTGLLGALGKTVVAAAVMGACVWVVTQLVGSTQGPGALLRLVVAGVVGLAVYFGMLVVLRSEDVGGLTRRLRRRPSPTVG
jgi:peptidoglycan biosynthesis protein MviN/MurJ (putative lipid II flippase)